MYVEKFVFKIQSKIIILPYLHVGRSWLTRVERQLYKNFIFSMEFNFTITIIFYFKIYEKVTYNFFLNK